MSNAGGTYLAVDVSTNKKVVLKESRPRMLMVNGQFDAIYFRKNEKDILQQLEELNFKNVPTLIEEFWEWKHYYIVVSYLDGEKLINQKQISTSTWTELKTFINTFHKHHITLGDISPQNIIVTSSGITSIDFELASSERIVTLGLPYMKTPGFRISKINLFDDTRYLADRQGIALLYMYYLFPTYDLYDQPLSCPGILLDYIKKHFPFLEVHNDLEEYLGTKLYPLDDAWQKVKLFYDRILVPSDYTTDSIKKSGFLSPVDRLKQADNFYNLSTKSLYNLRDEITVFSLKDGQIYDPKYNKNEISYMVKKFIQAFESIQ